MTYSLDFRQRVLQIKKDKHLSFRKTAKLFKIGTDTLIRWHRRLEPSRTRPRALY
ncbi:IS630 transposase-related protein [Thiotrichales bacterium 19S11-10]|nr:IS630 transposase-related protein [Thiotrichales bacterium 19S11-10]